MKLRLKIYFFLLALACSSVLGQINWDPETNIHIVEQGESFTSIAKQYEVDTIKLMELNGQVFNMSDAYKELDTNKIRYVYYPTDEAVFNILFERDSYAKKFVVFMSHLAITTATGLPEGFVNNIEDPVRILSYLGIAGIFMGAKSEYRLVASVCTFLSAAISLAAAAGIGYYSGKLAWILIELSKLDTTEQAIVFADDLSGNGVYSAQFMLDIIAFYYVGRIIPAKMPSYAKPKKNQGPNEEFISPKSSDTPDAFRPKVAEDLPSANGAGQTVSTNPKGADPVVNTSNHANTRVVPAKTFERPTEAIMSEFFTGFKSNTDFLSGSITSITPLRKSGWSINFTRPKGESVEYLVNTMARELAVFLSNKNMQVFRSRSTTGAGNMGSEYTSHTVNFYFDF